MLDTRFVIEGKNKCDGNIYRASVLPVKKRVMIPGVDASSSGMPKGHVLCQPMTIDSCLEAAVYRRRNRHPLIEIASMIVPGAQCLFEINDDLEPFSEGLLKSFVEHLIVNEDFNNIDNDSIDSLLKEYDVSRSIARKMISLPFGRKVPVLFFMRNGSSALPGRFPTAEVTSEAIFLAFTRDFKKPLKAPEFENYLVETFRNEGARDLMRHGYRVRLAERSVVAGNRRLVAAGYVDEVLGSSKSPQNKIEAIVEYFDSHETVGIGEPIRPYALAQMEQVRESFGQIVSMTTEASEIPDDQIEIQMELYYRYLSYGYAYRIAEELVQCL